MLELVNIEEGVFSIGSMYRLGISRSRVGEKYFYGCILFHSVILGRHRQQIDTLSETLRAQ